jgi:hypothetical protein
MLKALFSVQYMLTRKYGSSWKLTCRLGEAGSSHCGPALRVSLTNASSLLSLQEGNHKRWIFFMLLFTSIILFRRYGTVFQNAFVGFFMPVQTYTDNRL